MKKKNFLMNHGDHNSFINCGTYHVRPSPSVYLYTKATYATSFADVLRGLSNYIQGINTPILRSVIVAGRDSTNNEENNSYR